MTICGDMSSMVKIIAPSTTFESVETDSNSQIAGRILLPATGYIQMVWETFSMMVGCQYLNQAVEIEDLQLHQATVMDPKQEVKLQVVIHKGKLQWNQLSWNQFLF